MYLARLVLFPLLEFLWLELKTTPLPSDGGPMHSARGGWEDGGGYPPGEHPLEGVSNLEDLAEPEALSAKVDLSEVSIFFQPHTFGLDGLGFGS